LANNHKIEKFAIPAENGDKSRGGLTAAYGGQAFFSCRFDVRVLKTALKLSNAVLIIC
jgi:hypothetical protein